VQSTIMADDCQRTRSPVLRSAMFDHLQIHYRADTTNQAVKIKVPHIVSLPVPLRPTPREIREALIAR
jgi:hypothetical protein